MSIFAGSREAKIRKIGAGSRAISDSRKLDLTKIWIIQIFCYFCERMRFVTQFIIGYVIQVIHDLVNIIVIVLTNPRARDRQKVARARASFRACVRSNHYRTLAPVCAGNHV